MKQTAIQGTAGKDEKLFSFKSIAMGGPGLSAVVAMPDLEICFVNKQFETYLGYSNDDLSAHKLCLTEMLEHYQIERLLYQLNTVKDSIEAQFRYVVYHLRDKKGVAASYYVYAAPAAESSGLQPAGREFYHLTLYPNLSKWDIPFTSFITRELFLEHFNSEDFGTFEWIINVDRVFLSEGLFHIYEIENNGQEIDRSFMRSFIHPDDRERVEAETRKAMAEDHDLETDFKILTAKHKVKMVHCLARTIKNNEGRPVKYAGSVRDITAQRNIEEDLKAKVTELYHSNKELEEFAYIASHDLQEPLRKITVFSDRLAEKYKDVLSGDGAMYLSRMIASADNMRRLIDGLLEFSRITKTQQPFEPVDLNQVVRQVKTDLELVIEESKCIINCHHLPTVDAVASQMKQLFSNIIGNAIKFHKPDVTPVIAIEAAVLSPAERMKYDMSKNMKYHKITITDNGIGFEEEYAVRIFQVFQRLHGKSEYPGSGIGLAICKKILEYHNGTIYAENLPGTGARFTFILPQHQPPAKEQTV